MINELVTMRLLPTNQGIIVSGPPRMCEVMIRPRDTEMLQLC